MGFRRNGLRDERRRRVLIDETLHAGDSEGKERGASGGDLKDAVRNPVKPYTEAAIASSLLPVTAFLPKRPFITWSVWLVGILLIAGIEALYVLVYLRAAEELRPSLMGLDVGARGSLASWLASLVLGVAAFGSLLIYQIRRHRTDDYRGRYRWWLWLVPLLFVLSINAATGLHEVLSGVLTSATGAAIAVDGKGWWMLAYAAVFFPIVLQLVVELWRSRLAMFFLTTTTAAYIAGGLFELGIVQLADSLATLLCHSAVLLAAHLGVLVTVLAYGRYVYLEAHERLAARRRWLRLPKWKGSRKKPKAAATKSRAGKQVRVDEGHRKFGQEGAAPPTVTVKASSRSGDDDSDESDESYDDDRKLSKAERRRLRKEAQRLQRG